jgi:hypothetical protein
MDLLIDGLEARKNGERYHDFVITDAINNIMRAQEALDEGLKDPKKWWSESMNMSKVWVTLFPFIYMIQQRIFQDQDREAEGSSPTWPQGDSATEDTYEPGYSSQE